MAQLCKRRYDLLKRQGRCVQCTVKLPPGWAYVRCPPHHQHQMANRERRRASADDAAVKNPRAA